MNKGKKLSEMYPDPREIGNQEPIKAGQTVTAYSLPGLFKVHGTFTRQEEVAGKMQTHNYLKLLPVGMKSSPEMDESLFTVRQDLQVSRFDKTEQ